MPNPSTDDGRPKVGPASPEVQRAKLKEYESGVRKTNADKAASAPVAAAAPAKDSSVLHQLRDSLNTMLGPKDTAHNGKGVMDIVDEAVRGATGSNPDY